MKLVCIVNEIPFQSDLDLDHVQDHTQDLDPTLDPDPDRHRSQRSANLGANPNRGQDQGQDQSRLWIKTMIQREESQSGGRRSTQAGEGKIMLTKEYSF